VQLDIKIIKPKRAKVNVDFILIFRIFPFQNYQIITLFMKAVKVILCITFLGVSLNIFSQTAGFKKDNILLPEKLIISELVGFDSLYHFPLDSFVNGNISKPFFEINKTTDIIKVLAKRVMNSTASAYDASRWDEYYPYSSVEHSEQLPNNEVLKLLGQDTLRVISSDNDDERLVVKVIDLNEITSINFIEDWSFSVEPLTFKKNVYALEPVRRAMYSYSDDGEYRYRKTFRIYNKQNDNVDKSNLKLAATVKYEYFFNLDGTYITNNFQKLVEMSFQQSEQDFENNRIPNSLNAPFLNSFNQSIFIKTLLNSAFSGKVKVTDFTGTKTLTPNEARDKVFKKMIVLVPNIDTGENEERTMENDYTSEIVSVIFVEEWYFDAESLAIQKKVVGIAPVRYFYDYSNEQNILRREILFLVSLN